jgi:hypothetical protein
VTSRPEEQSGEMPLPAPDVLPADLPEPPRTGDDLVDAAIERLSRVATEPLEEQLAVYDAVHRTLQDRLADVEG